MAVITKQQLYKSFENGDRPDETDFQNLIDSTFNGAFSTLGTLSADKLKVDATGLSALDAFTFTDTVNFDSGFTSTGPSVFSGSVILTGSVDTHDIVFGVDGTNSVTFNSDIASNLIPDHPIYTVGASDKRWREIFAGAAVHEPITSSTIKVTESADLTEDAHHISFEELEIIEDVILNIYDEATLKIINV
jgi:hypothetical protein